MKKNYESTETTVLKPNFENFVWLTDRKNLEAEIHALREPRLTQPLSGPVPSASETSEVFVVVRCGFPKKMWGLAWGFDAR